MARHFGRILLVFRSNLLGRRPAPRRWVRGQVSRSASRRAALLPADPRVGGAARGWPRLEMPFDSSLPFFTAAH